MIYLKNFMIKTNSIVAVGKTDVTTDGYIIQIYTKEIATPIILCYDNEEERNDDFRQIARNWEAVNA